MSDSGLPKATMANFIKDRISDKRKVGGEFTALLLDLSKEFIDKVSAQANDICEKEGKKTINNDHFFSALKEMGMGDIITSLEKIDESLKLKQQKKQEDKLRVQQNIKKMSMQQEQQEQQAKIRLPAISKDSTYKPIDLNSDQPDFVEMLDQEEEIHASASSDKK